MSGARSSRQVWSSSTGTLSAGCRRPTVGQTDRYVNNAAPSVNVVVTDRDVRHVRNHDQARCTSHVASAVPAEGTGPPDGTYMRLRSVPPDEGQGKHPVDHDHDDLRQSSPTLAHGENPAAPRPVWRRSLTAATAAALLGCRGEASTLDPAGPYAARIAELAWLMTGIAVVIVVLVAAILAVSILRRSRPELWPEGPHLGQRTHRGRRHPPAGPRAATAVGGDAARYARPRGPAVVAGSDHRDHRTSMVVRGALSRARADAPRRALHPQRSGRPPARQ